MEKEKIKYQTLLQYLVEHNYNDIFITHNSYYSLTINLKKTGWFEGYNSQKYKTIIYYYDFVSNELVDFIIDLLYEKEIACVKTTTTLIKKHYEKILKEIEEV